MNKFKMTFLSFAMIAALSTFVACASKPQSENKTSDSISLIESSNSTQSPSVENSNSTVNSSVSASKSNSTIVSSASQIPSASNTQPGNTMTFSQRIDAYLDGASFTNQSVKAMLLSVGEYKNNETIKANSLFVSPNGTGSGESANDCCDLSTALDSVTAGQTIYLKGGTYNAENSEGFFVGTKGTQNNPIVIRNYPNETPIITNTHVDSEVYGLQFDAEMCYTIIEGLEISNIVGGSAYGIVTWGNINHIIIRNCNIHNIKTNSKNPDTDSNCGSNAILLFGEDVKPVSDVVIMENNCHDNVNGWCENISVTANCEYVYVLANTVYNNTNIGIDFYGNAEGYCKTASLNQPRFCVASANKISKSVCAYGDCAALYVDGARDIILQQNVCFNSQYGIEIGSEEKQVDYPVKNILVRNNVCANNTITGIRIGGYEQVKTGVVYSTKIINNTLINNGENQIILAKCDGISFLNNAVYSSKDCVPVSTDFDANYCKNITFDNNAFFVATTTESEIEFSLFTKSVVGISNFNTATKGLNSFLSFAFDSNYLPTTNALKDLGKNADFGSFDFLQNTRTNGTVDIGAIEK